MACKDEEILKTICQLYSDRRLEFDLAVERNTVEVLVGDNRGRPRYFKELVLRNWRYPSNDLGMFLDTSIIKQVGYEQLKF